MFRKRPEGSPRARSRSPTAGARRLRGKRHATALVALAFATSIVPNTGELAAAATGNADKNANEAAHEVQFRSEVGLPSGKAYLRSLHQQEQTTSAGLNRTYGVLLTDAEASALDVRNAHASANVDAVRGYLGESPLFGGLYLDHQANAVVVAVTGESERLTAELRALVPYPNELRITSADTSVAALDAFVQRISDDLLVLQREGVPVTGVGRDERTNSVEVNLTKVTDAAKSAIAARYPDAPLTFVEVPETMTTGEVALDAPPFRGAQYIDNVLNKSCSNGFVARAPGTVGNRYFVISAGHCGTQTWSQAGYPEGTSEQNFFYTGSRTDSMRIPISVAEMSREIFITFGNYRIVTSQQGYRADFVGQVVCGSGYQTEISCGTISTVNTTINYSNPTVTLYVQRISTNDVIPGDSGGSAFNGGMAMGITSGRQDRGGGDIRAIYSHIAEVAPAHGVTIATSCEGGLTPYCR